MEIKEPKNREVKEVKGYFSQEFYMSKNELASFLRNLADQVESDNDLKIKTAEWVLPFSSRDHAKVEIDLKDNELEIEIEFKRDKGKLILE